MSIPTPNSNENKTQEHRAFAIAIVFLIAIMVNLNLSISQSIETGAWQHYVRAGLVVMFGIATAIAMVWIRRGHAEEGIWLIIRVFLFTLFSTSLLLGGFGLILAFISLALAGGVTVFALPKEKRNRSYAITLIAALTTFIVDLFPLNYRIPAPDAMKGALPSIAGLVVIAIAVLLVRLSWDSILQALQSSIRNRLTAIVIAAAVIPALLISIVLGITAYTQVRSVLVQDTFDKLTAIENIKHSQLTDYLAKSEVNITTLGETAAALRQEAIAKLEAINTLKKNGMLRAFENWDSDVRDVASDPGVVVGINNLTTGFQNIGSTRARELYLGKVDLENAGDESFYSAAHFEQHGFFIGYTDIHGYEDAYLIDSAGNVVYSAQKGEAFGTNLVSGPYQGSNLATLYQKLINIEVGQSLIIDIALFDGENTIFIGTPIYQDATFVGVLAYQLSVAQIDALTQERSGLSASSETYLVGKVGDEVQLRSNRVVKEGAIGDPKPGLDSDRALTGETDHEFKVGSTGDYEISVFAPLEIPGLNWAIITTSNVVEIFSPQIAGQEKDFFSAYADRYGYNDIYLIDPEGYIFYSSAREADYQTNILTGEYNDTNLAELVRGMEEEKIYEFADFEFFAPSGESAAAFFGVPLLNESNRNEIDLFVAAEVPVKDINKIMNEAEGLGETGESYIIGQDFLGRMDSRFVEDFGVETTVLNPDFAVDTEAVRSAVAGETGQGIITDYRGLPVLSTWSPLVIDEPDAEQPEGVVWAVLTEIDESEALEPVNQLAGLLGLIIGLTALAVIALAVFLGARFALGFVTPILALTDTATQVADGNLGLRVESDSEDELGTLADTFDGMTAQLQETLSGLEQRVADRTRALETSTEVSRRLSTILDQDQLAKTVVDELVSSFGYYYAHIYRFEGEDRDTLVMKGGTGEAGRTLLARGHTIKKGRGLVGRAAETNTVVLVGDTLNEEGWLPNELLPETRSEIAVPISLGDQVLGVFDVQHNILNGLTEEDAGLLQSIANQVAIAAQNAQAYIEAQERAAREALIGDIGQKIQDATTIEGAMQVAVREVGRALGSQHTEVRLGIKDENGQS